MGLAFKGFRVVLPCFQLMSGTMQRNWTFVEIVDEKLSESLFCRHQACIATASTVSCPLWPHPQLSTPGTVQQRTVKQQARRPRCVIGFSPSQLVLRIAQTFKL